ncbi:glucose 1-dehydrogenase [Neorhodopirellula lusitana]|uniref:Glucose 1-dehydrogenase n=1 Tax=Neorhodopirellula lusitana TaxID=445327 RepID=A0ABY1Q7R0_9BACT|nr:SDR family oxidoreductase [Neorhodopirellula lusitana]SMP62150.1 glucose 1-dehydrogenase [Neorhodopirellula lusitana]
MPSTQDPARSLAGKRALISGSSQGIGSGIAIELAKAGADVTINFPSESNPKDCELADQVVSECVAHGVQAQAIAADMGRQSEVERLVKEATATMGGLDIVVSNAAYSDRHLMLESDLDEFRKTIDVTMWGAFHLLRCGAQQMVDAGQGGSVVMISSPMAHIPMPGAMAYNMSKAAIDQMARTAATELAGHRIRVNIVHPGWIDTPGERKFFSEESLAAEAAKLPWGRLGRSDEIGRGVVFLCDPASQYITGTTLTIDGGIQLPWRDMYRVDEANKAARKDTTA